MRHDAVANRSANGSAAFKRKMYSHWPKGLRQRHVAEAIQGPGSQYANLIWIPCFKQTFNWDSTCREIYLNLVSTILNDVSWPIKSRRNHWQPEKIRRGYQIWQSSLCLLMAQCRLVLDHLQAWIITYYEVRNKFNKSPPPPPLPPPPPPPLPLPPPPPPPPPKKWW